MYVWVRVLDILHMYLSQCVQRVCLQECVYTSLGFWCVTFGPQPEWLWWEPQLICVNVFSRQFKSRAQSRDPSDVRSGLFCLLLQLFTSTLLVSACQKEANYSTNKSLADVKEIVYFFNVMSWDRVRQNYMATGHESLGSAAVWQMSEWAVFSADDIKEGNEETCSCILQSLKISPRKKLHITSQFALVLFSAMKNCHDWNFYKSLKAHFLLGINHFKTTYSYLLFLKPSAIFHGVPKWMDLLSCHGNGLLIMQQKQLEHRQGRHLHLKPETLCKQRQGNLPCTYSQPPVITWSKLNNRSHGKKLNHFHDN